jgi:hypothetical protein
VDIRWLPDWAVAAAVSAAVSAQVAAPSAQDASALRPAVARVDMRNYSNASRTGYAHLIFRSDGTDVVVQVVPANGLTLPLHLYTYLHQGSCASPHALAVRSGPADGDKLLFGGMCA